MQTPIEPLARLTGRLKFLPSALIPLLTGMLTSALPGQNSEAFVLEQIPGGQAPLGSVEIQGVSAGAFNPALWENDQLHWVPDVRMPLLAPRMGGAFRNIYAPSAIEEGSGWRLFYSAWDGTDSGCDMVYSATTPDFIDFYDRHTVISNGKLIHVSNVNVQKTPDGSLHMLATAYPDPNKQNKPIYFFSPDGKSWNGAPEPYGATQKDIVKMEGYEGYELGDLNGANVLLHDQGKFFLYFSNWKDKGKVYWASGDTPSSFRFGGTSLETIHAPNDVKKFNAAGKDWYLMALHRKGDAGGLGVKDSDKLWYSLSNNGKTFGPEHRMPGAREELDRYIFAVAFLTSKDRVLGVLYGAGPSVQCARNQIFGYWLQKRLLLTAKLIYNEGNGAEYEAQGALGPDRQWFKLPLGQPFEGNLTVFSEDGVTSLWTGPVKLAPGGVYRLKAGNEKPQH